jgi:PAS domain S-box-containing protein
MSLAARKNGMADEQGPESAIGNAADGVALDSIPLHSTNLLTVVDSDGIIQYESPAVERIYGFEQSELIGEQVANYFHPDDREAAVAAFRRVVDSDAYTVESIEFRHRQADGTYLWVESVASSDPTPEGHYVINTRDISAAKQRERELERTNERLDEFASVLSHDLRNPLNVAQLRLELAAEDCNSDHLDAVAQAHDRMEALISDVLDATRADQQPVEPQSLDLEQLVSTCWQSVATDASTLTVEANRRIRADPARLRQLFENLFRNSVEHTPDPVSVSVGLTDGGFYLADDGPGIPPDERELVFEAGYSALSDGTGLGLQIVDDIVRSHDWEITITDSDAGGTRFEISGVEWS